MANHRRLRVVIILVGSGAYIYERDYREPSDSVFVGTWYMEDGCIDCANFITLQADHKMVGFSDSFGRMWLDYGGRWYAGGQLLVIHYDSAEEAKSIVMRILDIAPDEIRVRWSGRDMRFKRSTAVAPQASNQAMERTAIRREFAFRVARILSFQARTAFGGRRSSYSR